MNGHLVRFGHTRGITFTRSRPYHKNDNPHVEEKNNSVIRKFVGYDRHDTQEEVDLLNRTYCFLYLLVNWFLSSQKLLRGKGPKATSPRCTTQHGHRARGCWHGRMLQKRQKTFPGHPRAGLDMTSLLHGIFLCQSQLDEIAKKRITFGDQETRQLRNHF